MRIRLLSFYGSNRVLWVVATVATLGTVMGAVVARSAQATASQRAGETNAFFDAVSIKPLDPNTGLGRGGLAPGGGCSGAPPEITPGRIVFTNNKVFRLIAWAYGLNCGAAANLALITGAPPWARSDQFVVQATFPSGVSVSTPPVPGLVPENRYPEIQLMMRNMLADRFKLVVHREKKEISALELVVAKGGPKLALAGSGNGNSTAATPIGAQSMEISRISMDAFALTLRDFVRQPVVDRTGLTDEYRINIYYAGIEESPQGSAIAPLFTALQEQLGLKLQRTKTTEDVFVIDQLEKPTPN